MLNTLPLVIATVIPITILYMIYRLDLYKTGEYRMVLMCFLAGGISFVIAYFINPVVVRLGIIDVDNMRRFSAPVLEEILKLVMLVLIIRRSSLTYFVDGAIYGFAVGIGFAVFENYSYIMHSTSGMELAVARVISTNLVHASASSLVGIALGVARFEKSLKRILVVFAGITLATLLHILFNVLVTLLQTIDGLLLIISASLTGSGALVGVIYIIKLGLRNEKVWIKETLGQADRVTAGEAEIVNHMPDMVTLISPLAEKFGHKKAEKIEKILLIQARLGILRKSTQKIIDPVERDRVELKMNSLRSEMDQLRREVGIYAMLYLRNIFPDDDRNLWDRLEIVLRENKTVESNGVDVWKQLNQKIGV